LSAVWFSRRQLHRERQRIFLDDQPTLGAYAQAALKSDIFQSAIAIKTTDLLQAEVERERRGKTDRRHDDVAGSRLVRSCWSIPSEKTVTNASAFTTHSGMMSSTLSRA
jgi:hypothetical protein